MDKQEEVYRSKRSIMLHNFLGGIAWAIGTTIGLALVVTLVTLFLKYVDLVPLVGDFVADIVDYIELRQTI